MTECERYGMSHGCDEQCPVFLAGDCEFQAEMELCFWLEKWKEKRADAD